MVAKICVFVSNGQMQSVFLLFGEEISCFINHHCGLSD